MVALSILVHPIIAPAHQADCQLVLIANPASLFAFQTGLVYQDITLHTQSAGIVREGISCAVSVIGRRFHALVRQKQVSR